MPQNQTLGRGKLYFGKYESNAYETTPPPMRYLGNSPTFTISQALTSLDHYDSDNGLKVKDLSVQLQADMTGQFSLDDISNENLALWYLGAVDATAQGALSSQTSVITANRDSYLQLGVSAGNPGGARGVSNVTATDSVGTAATGTLTFSGQPTAADTVTIGSTSIEFVASAPTGAEVLIGADATATAQALKAYINTNTSTLLVTASGDATVLTLTANTTGVAGNSIALAKSGTVPVLSGATLAGGAAAGTITAAGNFTVDGDNGLIYILADAPDITDGDSITFTYDQAAVTRDMVISSGTVIYGRLQFISTNPVGVKKNHLYPFVKLSPNGDYNLKGDDWQTMTFTLDALVPPGADRAYIG